MVAYISRLHYPDPSANSLQTIQMASALAHFADDTWLFVHDLSAPEDEIQHGYGIHPGSLKFWRLHTRRWPALIYNHAMLRFLTYNSGVAAILACHPTWRRLPQKRKVLLVRSRLEVLYWGLVRPFLPWMRDWLFVCEIHDLTGDGEDGKARRMAQALRSYDLVITVNRALADDISQLTRGKVQAQVVPLCSGLERLHHPPALSLPADRIVIGYFGTIDLGHGIDIALQALEDLPERFVLRLCGRVREDVRDRVEAGRQTGRVEVVGPTPYAQIGDEIDSCHLALVPAGDTVHAMNYRSPLKIFDAMLRGKAIFAADVPCHRELLVDGSNAILFRRDDPGDLAAKILQHTAQPERMERIARTAWERSGAYTYPARAQVLLQMMEDARLQQLRSQTVHG